MLTNHTETLKKERTKKNYCEKEEHFEVVPILGFKVFSDKLNKILINQRSCKVINTISPNSYGISTKDSSFKNALQQSDFLLLDGIYFALASILLKGKNIKRNQGPDVFNHFITRLSDISGRVFFMGSTVEVLEKIKKRLEVEYPTITMRSYSPPFKPEFSEEDNKEIISEINKFKPNIVFIGMTAPKQEKWAVNHKQYLDCNLIISIGNVFDWYAGTQKAIHPFFFKIRMGWLVRIFLRPEIFKRNIGNQMLFFWHLLLMVLRLKKQPDA